MTNQTPDPTGPVPVMKEAIERAALAGSWPQQPFEVGSGVVAVYGDPSSARAIRYPHAYRDGEYEQLLALIAEGRMDFEEVQLGDVTLDPEAD